MSLKAKGLLSLMLSLPDDWDYSVSGLATLSKDGKDSVMSALSELEKFGYLTRTRVTNDKGQFSGIQYDIYEQPQPKKPVSANPILEKQKQDLPISEELPQSNTNLTNDLPNQVLNESNTEIESVLLASVNNQELYELYKDYIQMRKEIDAPLTAKGLEMLIKRNERLSKNNIKIQCLLLENSLMNGWKNVFPPTDKEIELASQEIKEDLKSHFGIE